MDSPMITNKTYHSDTSRISKSGLDLISRSPHHYWDKYLNPKREPRNQTKALILGSAVHKAILESASFGSEFIVQPEIDRRTNDGKKAYAAFLERAGDKMVLEQDDYEKVMRMRDAVLKHPLAAQLLSGGVSEQTVTWTDPDTGAKCKCRPDHISAINLLADIKTTEDARAIEFGKSALKYRYHVQSAFYLDGVRHGLEMNPEGFVFIAVEKEPPYSVALYFTEQDAEELGRETYKKDLAIYQNCIQTNQWPSYPETVSKLQLPHWAFKNSQLS